MGLSQTQAPRVWHRENAREHPEEIERLIAENALA